MAKYPVMVEYSYELKENLARRAIALFIDLTVVAIPLFMLYVFFGLGVLQANPMSALVGQLAPLLYRQQVQGVQETSPFLAMLVMVIFQSFLLPLYYTFRESNSRRTLGKYSMHLDPVRKDGMFPTKWDALQRNYIKYFAGAVGAYLLGIVGWYLFIGIACIIDYKLAPEYKLDLRQRITEVPFGTVPLNENPKVGIATISIDGGKWAKLKDKEKKARVYAKRLKREERNASRIESVHQKSEKRKEKIKLALGKTHEKNLEILKDVNDQEDSELPGKKKQTLLGSPSKAKKEKKKSLLKKPEKENIPDESEDLLEIDMASEPEIESKAEELALSSLKKKEIKEESEEEAPVKEKKKVSFFKRLFGGSKMKKTEEESPGEEVPERETGPSSSKKDSGRDETILKFMMDFDIDEKRAEGLFEMGYREKKDLKEAIPQDLMIIEGMNPTIAKRIINKA
jgi:hypothetical protein